MKKSKKMVPKNLIISNMSIVIQAIRDKIIPLANIGFAMKNIPHIISLGNIASL